MTLTTFLTRNHEDLELYVTYDIDPGDPGSFHTAPTGGSVELISVRHEGKEIRDELTEVEREELEEIVWQEAMRYEMDYSE